MRNLFDDVEERLRTGEVEEAWAAFAVANQAMIWLLPAERLVPEARALRAEGNDKLTGWRSQAVRDILDPGTWPGERELLGDQQAQQTARSQLIVATRIRDEDSANVYRRVALARRQLTQLGLVLALTLAAILATWISLTPDLEGLGPWSATMVWLTLLFGALGGCLSAMWSTATWSGSSRIPDRVLYGITSLVRPLLGAAGALGLVAVVQLGITPLAADSTASLLALAFVAGFSERVLVGAVGAAAGRS